jgi:uncharacterized membrane protein YbaN (DUF454 family)
VLGRTALGSVLLGVGLIGLVLPVIPGIPLLMAGAAILGPEHPLVRPPLTWLGRRRQAWRGLRRKQEVA